MESPVLCNGCCFRKTIPRAVRLGGCSPPDVGYDPADVRHWARVSCYVSCGSRLLQPYCDPTFCAGVQLPRKLTLMTSRMGPPGLSSVSRLFFFIFGVSRLFIFFKA